MLSFELQQIFLGTTGNDNIVIRRTNTKINRYEKAFSPIIYTRVKGLGQKKPTHVKITSCLKFSLIGVHKVARRIYRNG